MTNRILKLLGMVILLAVAFAGGVAWRNWAGMAKKDSRKPLYYVDPMHPWYKSDKPGIAPDCGMKLEPVYEAGAAKQEQRKPVYYRDPQNPKYKADAPGINPESGNDLEPVYDEIPATAVQVAADKNGLLGLTFGTAELTDMAANIRTTGRVAIDERRVEQVHSKTEGWVEKTFVNSVGEQVQKGQSLLTLYSPEMLASQQEYLLALKARDNMQHSSVSTLKSSGSSLVDAARRRLSLWDLSPGQLDDLTRTGQPIRTVTLYSPASGYITERMAFPNQRIGPEMNLYTIADLSRVWVMADVYESDAGRVRAGQTARVTLPGTGRTFTGNIQQMQPVAEAATRTLKARIELANPGMVLKPDMWVDVELLAGGGRALTVPAEAVIDSGTSRVVYVDRGAGNYEPRPVETGARFENRIEITKGLTAGERIVTSGAFLLNSESQMRSR